MNATTAASRLPSSNGHAAAESVDQKPKPKRKRKSNRKTPAKQTANQTTNQTKSKRLAGTMAVLAGCTTPATCLAMTTLAGHIAQSKGQPALWGFAPLTILIALLVVSTPHIAEAKQAIGWARWQAWSFAVALDAAIVVCELVSVMCKTALADISWLPVAVIVGAVAYSAALNTYVNLRHAKVVT